MYVSLSWGVRLLQAGLIATPATGMTCRQYNLLYLISAPYGFIL